MRFSSCAPRKTKDWIAEYQQVASCPAFYHHEPWLTLLAVYGLLGDQTDLENPERLAVFNELMNRVYVGKGAWAEAPHFSKVFGAQVEVCLRENLVFRSYLKSATFKNGAYHPYSDRCQTLTEKLSRECASLEGNTMLDALISGQDGSGRRLHIFIEAKFLSDISKDISYLPVRNQLARNIDCAIDLMTNGGSNLDGLHDFWFVLLTPGLFRTEAYGSVLSTPLDSFIPSRSRLFCYKMNDYLSPDLLKQDLPHWVGILGDAHWERISRRIGWMTFEDVVDVVCSAGILPPAEREAFCSFFGERGIV